MKELIFLLTILFIVSNADLIKKTFIDFKQNKILNSVKENFTNTSNQIFNLPNYKFYINSYDEIRNSNMLNMYFSELIDEIISEKKQLNNSFIELDTCLSNNHLTNNKYKIINKNINY